MIGIIGDKAICQRIKELCKEYLKEKLKIELSEEKTKISNVTKDYVRFLGVDIHINNPAESPPGGALRGLPGKKFKIVTKVFRDRKIKARINNVRPYFYIPTKDILEKLKLKGYIKTYVSKQGVSKLVPNAMTKWIFLDHRSIIVRYNEVIRGIYNYYDFVDNKNALNSIINLFLHHSCAKTLARKLNLKTRANAFKKFGRFLMTPVDKNSKIKPIGLFSPGSLKKTRNLCLKGKIITIDPFNITNWQLRTQINPFKPCIICGEKDNIVMHHVKHIRKGGIKTIGFLSIMAQLNRKQIPVCKPCHMKIHNGEYNGIKLTELDIKKKKR